MKHLIAALVVASVAAMITALGSSTTATESAPILPYEIVGDVVLYPDGTTAPIEFGGPYDNMPMSWVDRIAMYGDCWCVNGQASGNCYHYHGGDDPCVLVVEFTEAGALANGLEDYATYYFLCTDYYFESGGWYTYWTIPPDSEKRFVVHGEYHSYYGLPPTDDAEPVTLKPE